MAAPVLGRIADAYGVRAALMFIMFLPVLTAALVCTLREPNLRGTGRGCPRCAI
jgi:MFS family permease